ncbi:MAG: DUF4386 domain-containing protein [Cyclobacteriaceae bacterium]|nr:DUF4386 domain-containing protein [Cyclobacteriaceae bacterium]
MELQGTKALSKRTMALAAGAPILLMAVIAGVVMGTLFNDLFSLQGDDLLQTVNSSRQAFGWGILGWIIILLCDIVAAWALGVFYASVNKQIAQLTAWMRFLYSAILGTAIAFLVMAYHLVSTQSGGQIAMQLQEYINGFQYTWSFGLILFGFHLAGLSYLVWQKSWFFRGLSILLGAAAIGYLIIHSGNLLLPNFDEYKASIETIFMLPMILGEVGLAIWLVAKGGKN